MHYMDKCNSFWAMQGSEKLDSEGSKAPLKQKPMSSGQKRRAPNQGGSKEGKATLKPPKPGKSPVPKAQKTTGQKKEAGQTQAGSTKSPGNVSSFCTDMFRWAGPVLVVILQLSLLSRHSCRCDPAGADESQSKVSQESKKGARIRNQ